MKLTNPIRISLFIERDTYERLKGLIGSHSGASSHIREAIEQYLKRLQKAEKEKK